MSNTAMESISDFLKSPTTELTSIYGHFVHIFQIKNDLSSLPIVYCAFNNSLQSKSLSFRFNLETNEVLDVFFKKKETKLISVLSEEDKALISTVLPVYFGRIEKAIAKLTKEMRSDWGREFKTEIFECSGYTSYMSTEAANIERNCKLNVFPYTLATIDKKRATAFQERI